VAPPHSPAPDSYRKTIHEREEEIGKVGDTALLAAHVRSVGTGGPRVDRRHRGKEPL